MADVDAEGEGALQNGAQKVALLVTREGQDREQRSDHHHGDPSPEDPWTVFVEGGLVRYGPRTVVAQRGHGEGRYDQRRGEDEQPRNVH